MYVPFLYSQQLKFPYGEYIHLLLGVLHREFKSFRECVAKLVSYYVYCGAKVKENSLSNYPNY